MKRASVFKFDDRYLINSQSTTESGYAIATEPFIEMDKNTTIVNVAKSIILAMSQSKSGVKNSANEMEGFLNAVGVKKHKDLYKKSIHCMVYEKDFKIIFLPSINEGLKGGFRYLTRQKIEIDANATIDIVAASLEKTFSLCI